MDDNNLALNIKNDEDASKIIADFFKTKDVRYFNAFYDYVSNIKFGFIKIELDDINQLFYKVNDKTVFDYLLDNIKVFNGEFCSLIANNITTLKEIIRLNKTELLDYIDEDTLLLKYENDETVFDYLLKNDLLNKDIISNIFNNTNLIGRLKDKDIKLLTYLNGYILVNNTIDGISIIEYLFKNDLVDSELVNNISDNMIVDLCIKYNRSDLLPFLNDAVLKSKRNNKTILEYLLDNNIKPNKENRLYFSEEIIKVLCEHKLFDYFIDLYENALLDTAMDDKTILDVLLENGLTPNTKFFTKKKSLEIIIKNKRFDLIKRFNLNTLVSMHDLNNTYLDLILNEKEKGLNFSLSSLNTYSNNVKEIAKFYIIIAKHGFIEHVDGLEEKDLTKNNGSLLKELLSLDKDLTLNAILSPKTKEKINVAILLKMNGVEQKNINIDLHSTKLIDDYLEGFNSYYKNMKVSDEALSLLNEFRTLMLSDGKSEAKFVDAMIASYTYLISTNNEYGLSELKKLIEIKKKRKDFSIKFDKDRSHFSRANNSINLENVGLNTINHETGHALFYNLTDREIPKEFEYILYEVRNNPEGLKKVKEYSDKFQIILENVKKHVDEKYMSNYKIGEEEKKEILDFLNSKREELKEEYIKKGYDEETIDTVLSSIYNLEDYIEQDKRIKRKELMDAILRSEYGAFLAIGDVLDSIYDGKFRSDELMDSDHKIIESAYGHGIAYYEKGIDWVFDENIANYSAIIKSVDGKDIMSYLKEIVGEKFVNLIENYYRNYISLSNKDLSDEEEMSL